MNLVKAFILALLIIAIIVGLLLIYNCLSGPLKGVVIIACFIWMVLKIRSDVFQDKQE